MCVLVPGTNQVLDPLETQVTGSCEMPNLSAGNGRSLLQGQCVLLIEPFLWPPWRQAEYCFIATLKEQKPETLYKSKGINKSSGGLQLLTSV